MLLALLAACTPDDPKLDDRSKASDSGLDTDTTAPDSGTDTATAPEVDYCISQQDVTSGILGAAWRSPSGTLYAVGASSSARVRAPDGTWTLDPINLEMTGAFAVHGADDSAVWALTRFGALQRQPDGTWVDRGAPVSVNQPGGLHVFGEDDVLVLRIEDNGCADCYTQDTPVLLWWDGASWTEEHHPTLDGPIFGMTVLPDRTVVLATGDLVQTLGPTATTLSAPPELYARVVASAPDGTIVALGSGVVAMGTVEGGLVLADPGVPIYDWTSAWASSASDVWLAGQFFEQGVPHAVIVHWDGAAWTTVVEDHPDGDFRLAGGGGELFAVGSYDHELVLMGDEDGLSVDRERWAPEYLNELALDDVTGKAWATGYTDVLGVFEEGQWRGEPLIGPELDFDGLAVSDDRVVLRAYEELHVYEDGALTTTPTPGTAWRVVAAREGVLFAAGVPVFNDGPPQLGFTIMREGGLGWLPIEVSGLPEVARPVSLWADSPTELWLGLDIDDRGGLAHWDGAVWTLVLDQLSTAPDEVKRMTDGQLYFTQFSGEAGTGTESLWVYDGQSAYPVPDMPPDVRQAHQLADGTWFTSTIARAQTGDEDLYARLLQREPGEDWVEVLISERSIRMVGTDDTIWAEQDELSWTRAPCAP